MLSILEYIIKDNNVNNDEKIIIPITGIGDLYFTASEVVDFINEASILYPNVVFDVSTVRLCEEILIQMDKLNDKKKIRYFQITYISKDNKINNIVTFKKEMHDYNFEDIVKLVKNSNFNFFRINYILINNINDNDEEYYNFIESVLPIKDKIKIRISRVNETNASKFYGIKCGTINSMKRLSKLLDENNISNYIFYSKRNDNMNCGQLIYSVEKEKNK